MVIFQVNHVEYFGECMYTVVPEKWLVETTRIVGGKITTYDLQKVTMIKMDSGRTNSTIRPMEMDVAKASATSKRKHLCLPPNTGNGYSLYIFLSGPKKEGYKFF